MSERTLASELLHFSREPLTAVRDTKPQRKPNGKPDGLWVSVGPEWLEWCVSESFGLDRAKHITRVVLAADANVLRVTTASELDDFHRQYAVDRGGAYSRCAVEWDKVGADFDGIIIAPYQWSRRLDTRVSDWYYGWDVASGCIWRSRAVASLESISIQMPELANAE